jgi:hypothetical protein
MLEKVQISEWWLFWNWESQYENEESIQFIETIKQRKFKV